MRLPIFNRKSKGSQVNLSKEKGVKYISPLTNMPKTPEGYMIFNLMLPNELHRKLKSECSLQGITIKQLINDLIEGYLKPAE